eukprot:scpid110563/ scgid14765/ 
MSQTKFLRKAYLQRLYALSGRVNADHKDSLPAEQAISGLSNQYAPELRLTMAGTDLTVSGCLEIVRALRSAERDASSNTDVVAAAATGGASQKTAADFLRLW